MSLLRHTPTGRIYIYTDLLWDRGDMEEIGEEQANEPYTPPPTSAEKAQAVAEAKAVAEAEAVAAQQAELVQLNEMLDSHAEASLAHAIASDLAEVGNTRAGNTGFSLDEGVPLPE